MMYRVGKTIGLVGLGLLVISLAIAWYIQSTGVRIEEGWWFEDHNLNPKYYYLKLSCLAGMAGAIFLCVGSVMKTLFRKRKKNH